jgi:hypothetical protein
MAASILSDDYIPDSPTRRIVHIKGTAATTIGYVEAPDEDAALERAIEKFNVDPRLAAKLIAEKDRDPGAPEVMTRTLPCR